MRRETVSGHLARWFWQLHQEGRKVLDVGLVHRLFYAFREEMQERHPGDWNAFLYAAPWGYVEIRCGKKQWRQ